MKDRDKTKAKLIKENAELRPKLVKYQVKNSLIGEEAWYRSILYSVSDSIIIYNLEGRVIEVNPSACQTYGYRHDEFLKLSGKDLLHPNCSHMFDYFWRELKNSGGFFGEAQHIRKDGSEFYVDIKGSILNLDGNTYLLSVVRDITKRKQYEEMMKNHMENLQHLLDERTKEVKQAERRQMEIEKLAALGQVAAGVAHEINNPLAALSGELEVLKEKFKDNPTVFEILSKLTKRSERIGKIVDGLLFFSRHKTIKKIPCEIKKIIEDSIETFGDYLKTCTDDSRKRITIKKKLYPKLPLMKLEPDQMVQVLVNLLKNAYDSIPNKGTITLSSSLDKEKENVVIKIEDTGEGIPEKNLESIFVPFFTTKDVDKGTGLGLSICQGIIKAHNGTIEVDSKVGVGSIFTIKLPVKG